MARLLRRSAAPAWRLLLPSRLLPASTPARKLLVPRRHLAGSAPTSTRGISRYDPPNIPVNKGIISVPEGQAFVVERFGKYLKTLYSGRNVLIPFIDRISYVHSLKEQVIRITNQKVITVDNICLNIDCLMYVKIIDPYLASYGVENPICTVEQVAQTTMRSEIVKLTMGQTFISKEMLSNKIVMAINDVAARWGLNVLRYEIGDISPPCEITEAMELQATAEREEQAQIVLSEGAMLYQANLAYGEAEAVRARSKAIANGIKLFSATMRNKGFTEDAILRVAEQFGKAASQIAELSAKIYLPSDSSSTTDPARTTAVKYTAPRYDGASPQACGNSSGRERRASHAEVGRDGCQTP